MNRSITFLGLSAVLLTLSAPSLGDTFFACAHKENGKMRLVSGPGECSSTEKEVSWSSSSATGGAISNLEGRVAALEGALNLLNRPPEISSITAPQKIMLSGSATLSVEAWDDGIIDPLRYWWEGGDGVVFSPSDRSSTTATFQSIGDYDVSVFVTDGLATTSHVTKVSVYPDNTPPQIVVTEPESLRVEATDRYYSQEFGTFVDECPVNVALSITDDGLPKSPLVIQWESPLRVEVKTSADTGTWYTTYNDADASNSIIQGRIYVLQGDTSQDGPPTTVSHPFYVTVTDGFHVEEKTIEIQCTTKFGQQY